MTRSDVAAQPPLIGPAACLGVTPGGDSSPLGATACASATRPPPVSSSSLTCFIPPWCMPPLPPMPRPLAPPRPPRARAHPTPLAAQAPHRRRRSRLLPPFALLCRTLGCRALLLPAQHMTPTHSMRLQTQLPNAPLVIIIASCATSHRLGAAERAGWQAGGVFASRGRLLAGAAGITEGGLYS